MTATDYIEADDENPPPVDNVSAVSFEEILNFLSSNPRIIFKSQQIDDPDLDYVEKEKIAQDIYTENPRTFLLRFGPFLSQIHLNHFRIVHNEDDIQYIVDGLSDKLKHKEKTVRNRRYNALKEMSQKEDGYFSEMELMRREPNLYEQLVGQYLTDTERKVRAGFDPHIENFSSVLLETMDRDQTEQLRKTQKVSEGPDIEEDDDDDDDGGQSTNESEKLYPHVPTSYRKQWGNFEDEDSQPPATAGPSTQRKEKKQKYVTADEREILRQEFIGIMNSRFIEGDDPHFDYSTVDENPQYDDLDQIDRDKEDAYFNDDDDEEELPPAADYEEASDDELDCYMKTLE